MRLNQCYNCWRLRGDADFSCNVINKKANSIDALARLAPEPCTEREPREYDPPIPLEVAE